MRIGSRGSQLALWQANHIADRLRALGHEVTIEIIRTTGDAMQNVAFAKVGSKGMFIKEIEEALLDGRIDLAVHSLKDLPTELDPAFALAAIPDRVDPRDALLSARYDSFAALPEGARVGTSSLRRRAQLRACRDDLQFEEFRGNIDTRIRKMVEGQVDAIILASAGLERLGLIDYRRECFDSKVLCPAAGQGALAIETRSDDLPTRQAMLALEDEPTRYAVTAERTALGALGGGCQVPIGVHCVPEAGDYSITGVVAAPEGGQIIRAAFEQQDVAAEELGQRLADELLRQGARSVLEAMAL